MLEITLLLLPLFSIIAIGWILGRTSLVNEQWVKILNLFSYYIAFPALIFNSIAQAEFSLERYGLVIIIQLLLACSIMLGTYYIMQYRGSSVELQNTFTPGLYLANTAYIGIPALQLTLGKEAAAEGAIIVAVMLIVVFTLGIYLLEKSNNNRVSLARIGYDIIKNPLLWAAIAGLVVSTTQIQLPGTISKTIIMLAQAASPVVLVGLGIFIAHNHPKKEALHIAALLTFLKMIILPIIFFVVWMVGFGFSEKLAITFIQLTMPLAITGFAFTEIYPMHKSVLSTAIVLSTLCALVTIPFAIWLTGIV